MQAITSLYSSALVRGVISQETLNPKRINPVAAADVISVLMSTPAKPKVTVLKASLLLELQKLTKSLRAQVRNSVALIKFLHAKKVDNPVSSVTAETEQPAKQSSFGESLTFRFSTDPE